MFLKPPSFSGAFSGNSIYVFANHTQFGPSLLAKVLQVHRINVRVATKEEQGLGRVGERVQATLTQGYYTKTETGSAIAGALETYDAGITNKLGQKANASVVQAIDTRVKQTETGLSALSDSLTQVSAQSDRGTASGLLRITSEAKPSGVASRLGLRAEAAASGASYSSAIYLEARSDGTSAVSVVADRFAMVSNASGGGRMVPFVIDGGVVYMNMLMVKDLSVDSIKIADGAITRQWSVEISGAGQTSLMVNAAAASSRFLVMVLGAASARDTAAAPSSTYLRTWMIRQNQYVAYQRTMPLLQAVVGSNVNYFCDEIIAGGAIIAPPNVGNFNVNFLLPAANSNQNAAMGVLQVTEFRK